MNSFGNIFKITTWGESHGPAVGVVIDGCPSGLPLNQYELTSYLKENDRPILEIATERKEPNEVELLSGINEGRTLGTPISIVIKNIDFIKKDYSNITTVFRPGHGDYTYYKKYNINSITGGGRASGRECIARLAAGYIAEKIIKTHFNNFSINTEIIELAGIKIKNENTKNKALNKVLKISKRKDSTGGAIKITVSGIPSGIGEPVFQGIDSRIAGALISIGSVKSVDIGRGRECSKYSGSDFNDDFDIQNGEIKFKSNNNGGILAGISTGYDLEIKISVKPTPSIGLVKTGITADNHLKEISVNGRHDKNITPRVAPIARAMICLVITDFLMLCGKINKDKL
ncbi:MAG: chorismate synthase [Spirochaetes bacterium]|nr:chorismate synthase [Spirochaetota bacterium]